MLIRKSTRNNNDIDTSFVLRKQDDTTVKTANHRG